MSAYDRIAEGTRWLTFAREELRGAEHALTEQANPPRLSCYWAQQAAEKAIKVALVTLEIQFLYRHDLEYLNTLLPSDWQFDVRDVDLISLTQWGVISRYPGDLPLPTKDDAILSIGHARVIVDTIEAKLEDFGARVESGKDNL